MKVFPLKCTSSEDTTFNTLEELKWLRPDFTSVTYGAGRSANNSRTLEIAPFIKTNYTVESAAHLPCTSFSEEEPLLLLDLLKEQRIENTLVLRGGISLEHSSYTNFFHVDDLAVFIEEHADFNIVGACYPERRVESKSALEGIHYLKRRVDTDIDHLTMQLFLDNDYLYTFREYTVLVGIGVLIEAGIMPIVNKKQIERIIFLCGVQLPRRFVGMTERYGHNPITMRDAGIAHTTSRAVNLLVQGADSIHLYTMNNSYITRKIYKAVSRLLAA